jgi:hypothetical protein
MLFESTTIGLIMYLFVSASYIKASLSSGFEASTFNICPRLKDGRGPILTEETVVFLGLIDTCPKVFDLIETLMVIL